MRVGCLLLLEESILSAPYDWQSVVSTSWQDSSGEFRLMPEQVLYSVKTALVLVPASHKSCVQLAGIRSQ